MKLKKLALSTALTAALIGFGSSAQAVPVTQLALLVDGSGSIGAADFSIFRAGIASALSTVNTNSSVEVTVIRFSTTASVIQAPLLIDSVATRTDLVNTVNAMAYTGGNTCYECAFDLTTSTLNFHPGNADYLQFVNMLTDGAPNTGGNGVTGRNELIAAGADIISFEGVNLNADTTAFLKDSLAYPQPGVVAPPFPNPISSNGFVVSVASFLDVEGALKQKFVAGGISQVPEPATLVLLGIGLAGLGVVRRYKA